MKSNRIAKRLLKMHRVASSNLTERAANAIVKYLQEEGETDINNLSDYDINNLIETSIQAGDEFTFGEKHYVGLFDYDQDNLTEEQIDDFDMKDIKVEQNTYPGFLFPIGTKIKVTKGYFQNAGYMDFGGVEVEADGYKGSLELWGYAENYTPQEFCDSYGFDYEGIKNRVNELIKK